MPYKDLNKRKEFLKQYFLNNKERIQENAKRFKEKRYKWYNEIKEKLFCIECGENRIPCLDFHHRDPNEKDKVVATLVNNCSTKKKILEEIAKCDVLCKNCHAMEHAKVESQDYQESQ